MPRQHDARVRDTLRLNIGVLTGLVVGWFLKRVTCMLTALDHGASVEDVSSAAEYAHPSTTKLYDRRGYNPEKSASFFANY